MIWINGKPQADISARDRAVQFGDGCFTTARIHSGRVMMFGAHIERLKAACARLLITDVNWSALEDEMRTAASARAEGVLKVIITRGEGGRGYSPAGCGAPLRLIALADYPVQYHHFRQTGVRLALSDVRLSRNPLLAGIKHLNRLEQVLIRAALDQTGADEAVVLDTDGMLVECCAANLFWRKGETLFTPDLRLSGVNGIQRQAVILTLRAKGVTIREVEQPFSTLADAEEVFITNALMPVLPVRQIDTWHYPSRHLFDQLPQYDD